MKHIYSNFHRGSIIESTHKVKLSIIDKKGKSLISSGNDKDLIYPRSSIKIFQSIPFVESGAIIKFNLNPKIIALSSSSHRGEAYHINELKKWIKKININKSQIKCGLHYPLNFKASERLLRSNKRINELYNNCSGKHLGMLSSCIANNYNTKTYLNFNHPHQVKIRNIFEKFSNVKIKDKNFGIDGCSAPQYSFKIKDINTLLMNLIKSFKGKFIYSYEVNLLIKSILNNPNFIGGTDSLDSRIMNIANKNIFCKGGAEGVFLFIDLNKEISGVIKIVDGNERAIPPIIYNLFKKLKIFNEKQLSKFAQVYQFNLQNHAKIKIGSISTSF